MKVLITGNAGFIGFHMARALLKHGANRCCCLTGVVRRVTGANTSAVPSASREKASSTLDSQAWPAGVRLRGPSCPT